MSIYVCCYLNTPCVFTCLLVCISCCYRNTPFQSRLHGRKLSSISFSLLHYFALLMILMVERNILVHLSSLPHCTNTFSLYIINFTETEKGWTCCLDWYIDVTMAADCLSEMIHLIDSLFVCLFVAHLAHVLHTCNRNLLPASLAPHSPCWIDDGLDPAHCFSSNKKLWCLSFSHSLILFVISPSLMIHSGQMRVLQLTPPYWCISLERKGRQSLPLMTSTGTKKFQWTLKNSCY